MSNEAGTPDLPDVGELAPTQHPWYSKLRSLEMEMLDPAVRGSRWRLNSLLRDDFVEVGSSGRIYSKWMVIDMLTREEHATVQIRDLTVRSLAEDVALVTYRSLGTESQVRRSSIWVLERGRWRMAFHQGTRLPDARQRQRF